jgi:hypothetical protein
MTAHITEPLRFHEIIIARTDPKPIAANVMYAVITARIAKRADKREII